jgi:hypothetical protein
MRAVAEALIGEDEGTALAQRVEHVRELGVVVGVRMAPPEFRACRFVHARDSRRVEEDAVVVAFAEAIGEIVDAGLHAGAIGRIEVVRVAIRGTDAAAKGKRVEECRRVGLPQHRSLPGVRARFIERDGPLVEEQRRSGGVHRFDLRQGKAVVRHEHVEAAVPVQLFGRQRRSVVQCECTAARRDGGSIGGWNDIGCLPFACTAREENETVCRGQVSGTHRGKRNGSSPPKGRLLRCLLGADDARPWHAADFHHHRIELFLRGAAGHRAHDVVDFGGNEVVALEDPRRCFTEVRGGNGYGGIFRDSRHQGSLLVC